MSNLTTTSSLSYGGPKDHSGVTTSVQKRRGRNRRTKAHTAARTANTATTALTSSQQTPSSSQTPGGFGLRVTTTPATSSASGHVAAANPESTYTHTSFVFWQGRRYKFTLTIPVDSNANLKDSHVIQQLDEAIAKHRDLFLADLSTHAKDKIKAGDDFNFVFTSDGYKIYIPKDQKVPLEEDLENLNENHPKLQTYVPVTTLIAKQLSALIQTYEDLSQFDKVMADSASSNKYADLQKTFQTYHTKPTPKEPEPTPKESAKETEGKNETKRVKGENKPKGINPRKFPGFVNTKNSCPVIAALQTWASNPFVRKALLQDGAIKDIQTDGGLTDTHPLKKILLEYEDKSNKAAKGEEVTPINPKPLEDYLDKKAKANPDAYQYRKGSQGDPHEIMQMLENDIDPSKCSDLLATKEDWNSYEDAQSNEIWKKTSHNALVFMPTLIIRHPEHNDQPLDGLIKDQFLGEISGTTKVQELDDQGGSVERQADMKHKKEPFASAPNVLFIQLDQASRDARGQVIKNAFSVKAPLTLQLPGCIYKDNADGASTEYELVSAIVHIGANNQNGGHYVTHIRNGNKLKEMDDETDKGDVSLDEFEQKLQKGNAVYAYFYVKKGMVPADPVDFDEPSTSKVLDSESFEDMNFTISIEQGNVTDAGSTFAVVNPTNNILEQQKTETNKQVFKAVPDTMAHIRNKKDEVLRKRTLVEKYVLNRGERVTFSENEVINTPGNEKVTAVLHVVVPEKLSDSPQKRAKQVKTIVRNSLQKAQSLSLTHVAFPLIPCTDSQKLDVRIAMENAVKEFAKENRETGGRIEQVKIILTEGECKHAYPSKDLQQTTSTSIPKMDIDDDDKSNETTRNTTKTNDKPSNEKNPLIYLNGNTSLSIEQQRSASSQKQRKSFAALVKRFTHLLNSQQPNIEINLNYYEAKDQSPETLLKAFQTALEDFVKEDKTDSTHIKLIAPTGPEWDQRVADFREIVELEIADPLIVEDTPVLDNGKVVYKTTINENSIFVEVAPPKQSDNFPTSTNTEDIKDHFKLLKQGAQPLSGGKHKQELVFDLRPGNRQQKNLGLADSYSVFEYDIAEEDAAAALTDFVTHLKECTNPQKRKIRVILPEGPHNGRLVAIHEAVLSAELKVSIEKKVAKQNKKKALIDNEATQQAAVSQTPSRSMTQLFHGSLTPQ